ncbi:MAG: hypothetical protein ACPHRO_00870 [Nannocystaceae bacterium]
MSFFRRGRGLGPDGGCVAHFDVGSNPQFLHMSGGAGANLSTSSHSACATDGSYITSRPI